MTSAPARLPVPEQLGFDTAYFDLPGIRLHAAVAGPEAGVPVLLLHGFPEFFISWRRQIGPLARAGLRVVAPDQRGYNLSGKTPPYDQATLVADIVNLIDALGGQPVHVVGHDWGAAVAWGLAEHHPQRLRTLSILNVPHPRLAARAVLRGNVLQALRSTYVMFFQLPRLPEWLLSRNDFAALRLGLRATSRPGTFSEADLDRYRDAWAQPGALTAMLGWYRAFVRGLLRPSQRQPLPRIEVPSQIIWGERDQALGVELATQSARLLANGRLHRLPDATHWVQHEFPEIVNRRLLELMLSG